MEEIWRKIKDFENYEVSNLGNVRNTIFKNNVVEKAKIKEVKQYKNNSGYYVVNLSINNEHFNRTVHRLVASVFIPNENNLPQVNHIDGNKENNNVSNLEWCDKSQNMKHAYRIGLRKAAAKGKYGGDNYKAIKVNMIDKKTNKVINQFNSIIDGAKYVGAKKSCHIVSCCRGRLKSAYGYIWEYANDRQTGI